MWDTTQKKNDTSHELNMHGNNKANLRAKM